MCKNRMFLNSNFYLISKIDFLSLYSYYKTMTTRIDKVVTRSMTRAVFLLKVCRLFRAVFLCLVLDTIINLLYIFNLFLYLFVICVYKKSYNLSVFIPLFSYNSQPKTPFVEIANILVYFLNTSCDCVLLHNAFQFHYSNDFVFVMT